MTVATRHQVRWKSTRANRPLAVVLLLVGCWVLTSVPFESNSGAHGGTTAGTSSPVRASNWDLARVLSHLEHLTAGGDPMPPPPAAVQPYLRDFLPIYVAYQTIADDKKPPFSVWLVMHGVIDPQTHHAMMTLYRWVELWILRNAG